MRALQASSSATALCYGGPVVGASQVPPACAAWVPATACSAVHCGAPGLSAASAGAASWTYTASICLSHLHCYPPPAGRGWRIPSGKLPSRCCRPPASSLWCVQRGAVVLQWEVLGGAACSNEQAAGWGLGSCCFDLLDTVGILFPETAVPSPSCPPPQPAQLPVLAAGAAVGDHHKRGAGGAGGSLLLWDRWRAGKGAGHRAGGGEGGGQGGGQPRRRGT